MHTVTSPPAYGTIDHYLIAMREAAAETLPLGLDVRLMATALGNIQSVINADMFADGRTVELIRNILAAEKLALAEVQAAGR